MVDATKQVYVGWDTETHLIQEGLLTPPVVCHSFASDLWKGQSIGTPHIELKLMGQKCIEELLRGNVVLAGANIAYDFGVICAEDPHLVPLVFKKYQRQQVHDVLIAALLDFIARGLVDDGKIIDPRDGIQIRDSSGKLAKRMSLEIVTDLYLGRKDAKENDIWRLSYALLDGKPLSEWPPEAIQYPKDDAQNTLEVALQQIEVAENLHDLPRQCYAHWCAHLGAVWGFRTDGSDVDALAADLEAKLEAAKVKFAEHGIYRREKQKGVEVWVKTKKVLEEMVTKAYLGKPPRGEPTEKMLDAGKTEGNVSCERTVLEDSGDEVLEEFAGVSKIEKLASYIPSLRLGARVPLNVQPNILLASGRASYEGMVQLMPRKGGIRERCVAREGHVWSSVDYEALEAHTLGQVCLWTVGFSKLADALNNDMDPHCIFVENMTGIPYAEVMKLKETDQDIKDKRQGAKAANYGFPGGMSAPKFVQAKRKEGLKICQIMKSAERCGAEKIDWWNNHEILPTCKPCTHSSEELRIIFMETWEEMSPFFIWVKKQIMENDNALEQFWSKRIRGGLRFTSGANTLFQGLAADGAKNAVIRMTEEMYLDTESPLYGSRLMIFSHDETILEIPEDRGGLRGTVTDAAKRQALIQVEEMSKVCPDMKRIKAEPALMRRWYKDAKPVWVDGQLTPWVPKEKK